MYSINLEWKDFSVNLEKVKNYFRTNCSSNFDGLFCDDVNLKVYFKNEASIEDLTIINTYWDNATITTFQSTMEEIIIKKINEAIIFGNSLVIEATISNVAQGITQAGKTKEVSDYFRALQRYLKEGSLYAAVDEVDRLISIGIPEDLQPFVTIERLNDFKNKLLTYLGT